MYPPATPIEVFCSYAEEDAAFLEPLERHLNSLLRSGTIITWHRHKIALGKDWKHELGDHLHTASLVLLLISSDFLASDYQYGVELQQAMQRHDDKQARVIPILLRPCDWERAPFTRLQVLPRNHKAITRWPDQDEALTEVAKEIRALVEGKQPLPHTTFSPTRPQIWQVPYRKNPFFTGRDDLLDQIADTFQKGKITALSQAQAMSGLGGVGKTQLAVEYAYRHRDEYQNVFWCLADSLEALTAGYVAIAQELSLPQYQEQDQTIAVQAVIQWLRTHPQWLLILDNADDLSLLPPFLPPTFEGQILLTTRAFALGGLAQRIEVKELKETPGVLLLLRRAGMITRDEDLQAAPPQEQTAARALSQELGGLPLALDQAGAYIEETGCSLQSYHQKYQSRQMALLKLRGGFAPHHPEPVATTWSLSFEKVEQANPFAAEVLRCCAFLAPDAIPEDLILKVMELRKTPSEELDAAMAVLRAYSLIQRQPQTQIFQVHRLVQAFVYNGMDEWDQTTWVNHIVDALDELFPCGEPENWKQCEQYLPHVQACTNWIEQRDLLLENEAKVCYSAGYYLHRRALFTQAEPLYLRALHIWEHSRSPNHPEIVFHGLAELYREQGHYSQAEPLYLRALHIWENTLGPDHPLVAYPLNGLAELYREQGHYSQAEPLYLRALHIREHTLGPDHSLVAYSLNSLAILYKEQGYHSQAEPLYLRALHIREHSLGPDHPRTQTVRANYASLLKAMEHDGEVKG